VIAKAHLAFGYITGNDLTGTGNDREIISHVLYPYFPRCCPELLQILSANNEILNPTNLSPSDI
jgi:hypothetical protein